MVEVTCCFFSTLEYGVGKKYCHQNASCGFITLQIALSEDDLTVVMKILLENLGGASSQPNTVPENIGDKQIIRKGKVPNESDVCEGTLIQELNMFRERTVCKFQHCIYPKCLKHGNKFSHMFHMCILSMESYG